MDENSLSVDLNDEVEISSDCFLHRSWLTHLARPGAVFKLAWVHIVDHSWHQTLARIGFELNLDHWWDFSVPLLFDVFPAGAVKNWHPGFIINHAPCGNSVVIPLRLSQFRFFFFCVKLPPVHALFPVVLPLEVEQCHLFVNKPGFKNWGFNLLSCSRTVNILILKIYIRQNIHFHVCI